MTSSVEFPHGTVHGFFSSSLMETLCLPWLFLWPYNGSAEGIGLSCGPWKLGMLLLALE